MNGLKSTPEMIRQKSAHHSERFQHQEMESTDAESVASNKDENEFFKTAIEQLLLPKET